MISSVPVLAAVAAPSTERSSPSRATPTRKTPISPEIIRAPICQDSSLSLDAKKIAKVERNGSPQSRVQIRKNRGSEKILLRKVTWCGAPNYGDRLEPLSPTVVVRSPSAALTESTGFIEFGGWGPMSGSGRLLPQTYRRKGPRWPRVRVRPARCVSPGRALSNEVSIMTTHADNLNRWACLAKNGMASAVLSSTKSEASPPFHVSATNQQP